MMLNDSEVYKGRKKFTIHLVAVKSTEKCQREKVMTEVELLSGLRHPKLGKWQTCTTMFGTPVNTKIKRHKTPKWRFNGESHQ